MVQQRRPTADRPLRRRTFRRRLLLLGLVGLAIGYYSLALTGLGDRGSNEVPIDGAGTSSPADRITLQVEAVDLDPGTGVLDLRLRPVPHGTLEGDRTGQLRDPLHVELAAAGQPPLGFDFAADQLVDPVSASVETANDPRGFPFDRTGTDLRLEATTDGEPVSIDIELTDETEGWDVAAAGARRGAGMDLELRAGREMLAISFALLYIAGTVVVTLIAVAVIGGAVNRRRVDFERVIWLGAMLVVIPAVRNEMPGVPPVGTAVDLLVFLPAVVIVAAALLAAIAVLVLDEITARAPATEGE